MIHQFKTHGKLIKKVNQQASTLMGIDA